MKKTKRVEWNALTGTMSIGIGQNRDAAEPDGVTIDIFDSASNLLVARLDLSYLALCDAFRGRGNTPCSIRVNANPDIGKRHEVKSEEIELPSKLTQRNYRDSQSEEAYAAHDAVRDHLARRGFCADGWEPDVSNAFNGHNRLTGGKNVYRITFHRYVAMPRSNAGNGHDADLGTDHASVQP